MDQPDTQVKVQTQTCADCGEHPGLVQRQRRHYCRECWVNHCSYKFRKRIYELGKGKVVKVSPGSFSETPSGTNSPFGAPENLLIYYDCSPSAKALLALVRDTILENKARFQETERPKILPLPFVFTVLFIHEGVNESGTLNASPRLKPGESGTSSALEELRSWLSVTESRYALDFPLVVSSLEKSLSSSEQPNWREILRADVSVDLPFDPNLNSRLCVMVDSLKSSSSRIDFLYCLRQNLIVSIAQGLKMSKVVLPDQQTTMSVKMFSMISLGRGAQLADKMSFVTKVDTVDMTRPLMDLSSDDLLDYLSCLDSDTNRTTALEFPNKEKRIDNIRSQCEDFILTLQKGFPATVPTLTKIGAKLECPAAPLVPVLKCRLCKQRLDLEANETIEFCYGCSNILKEMKDASALLELLQA